MARPWTQVLRDRQAALDTELEVGVAAEPNVPLVALDQRVERPGTPGRPDDRTPAPEPQPVVQREPDAPSSSSADADLDRYAKGGGWYEIPGVDHPVQGRDAARQALAAR